VSKIYAFYILSVQYIVRNTTVRVLKVKERKSIYTAPFVYYALSRVLRHRSHSFTCKLQIEMLMLMAR